MANSPSDRNGGERTSSPKDFTNTSRFVDDERDKALGRDNPPAAVRPPEDADKDPSEDGPSAGTPEKRPPEAGPPIDGKWWDATAAAIFQRFPGAPGAGEGSRPDQIQCLARRLRVILGDLASDEASLRKLFGASGGSTDVLREKVVANLAAIAAPVLSAWKGARGAQREEARESEPELVTLGSPSPPPKSLSRRPNGGYPAETRCIHGQRFSNQGRLRCVTNHRLFTYEVFWQSPDLRRWQRELATRADAQTSKWADLYAVASAIAAGGTSPDRDVDDDYHSLPPEGIPGIIGGGIGLPSSREVGNVVHEELQKRYLNSPLLATHLIVTEHNRQVHLYRGKSKGETKRVRTPFWDLVVDARPDEIAALGFSLGSRQWHLRPDLVNLTTGALIEIKPIRSVHKGVLQVWRYTHNFRLAKFFDEKVSGGTNPGYELTCGYYPPDLMKPIKLAEHLQGKALKQYGDFDAVAMMTTAMPGILFYVLEETGRSPMKTVLRVVAMAFLVAVSVVVVCALIFTAAEAGIVTLLAEGVVATGALIGKGLDFIIDGNLKAPTLPSMTGTVADMLKNDSAQIVSGVSQVFAATR